jgi:hypothetical protein
MFGLAATTPAASWQMLVPDREEADMPDERARSQERTTTLLSVYDPDEDYTRPPIDMDEISSYLGNHVRFEQWLNAHPEPA